MEIALEYIDWSFEAEHPAIFGADYTANTVDSRIPYVSFMLIVQLLIAASTLPDSTISLAS